MSRCAAGDREAFGVLYERFAPRVYGLIVAQIGKGPEADDAFQNAMWEIWKRSGTYDARLGSVAAWVLMLARSKAIDLTRRRRSYGAARDRLAQRTAEQVSVNVEPARIEHKEQAEACVRLLSDLPKDEAIVIQLAYLKGLTRDEIASALGIPVGTVKTRIRSGVRSLSVSLSQGGGGAK